MSQPTLPNASLPKQSFSSENAVGYKTRMTGHAKTSENSDVLISAVISSYLLTHLHHVLQRAEYGAAKEGKTSQASNFAQLRKVLCMDARSMADASASGMRDSHAEKFHDSKIQTKVA
tara:strand:- start:2720 stop:3073 length:354 start_codon:yes stop_codon:yes gene_type:complete